MIRSRRGGDRKEGQVGPKSGAGTRTVPITGVLRCERTAHRSVSATRTFAFGHSDDKPLG